MTGAADDGPLAIDPARATALRNGLAAVRQRIEAACRESDRDPAELTVIVVTKTYPASDVAALVGLGVRDVGENRDQEAGAKWEACAGLGVRWHFIGQLQTNKAKAVARYADLVHSVDRPALAIALGKGAVAAGRQVDCLLQVSLDGDPTRGGISEQDLLPLAQVVAATPGLHLGGLMAVAPRGVDPRVTFASLPRLRSVLVEAHPGANLLSAGMSGDLEAAIACGATHLRVGSAVLGARPRLA